MIKKKVVGGTKEKNSNLRRRSKMYTSRCTGMMNCPAVDGETGQADHSLAAGTSQQVIGLKLPSSCLVGMHARTHTDTRTHAGTHIHTN